MDVRTVISIDLAEYGGDGIMEMGMPSFRKMNEIRNETSKYIRLMKAKDSAYMEGLQQGDLEILSVLMYVRKAPFTCSIEGWLRFCDRLEENDITASHRLFSRMQEVMREFEALDSPFAPSQAAESASSE